MTALDEAELRRACEANRHIGRDVLVVAETSSTNDLCHDAAKDGGGHGLVIFAEHQTQGRGQHGRQWSAPPGAALLFSVLLHPPAELDRPTFLTAWAAAAIARCLHQEFELDARIKWPNDVLVANRKICGILVERRHATVVGVGLNVAIEADQFPHDLRLPATSLLIETGAQIDRNELAIRLLDSLDRLYCQSEATGTCSASELWRTYAEELVGRLVVASTTQGEQFGQLLNLSPDHGVTLRLERGDVVHIQPERLLRIRGG